MEELERKKVRISAEVTREREYVDNLIKEGKNRNSRDRRPVAYKIMRLENGLQRKNRMLEGIEKEILGLDNLRGILNSRKELNSRPGTLDSIDIDAVKQEAMKDRIEREDYEKKLQDLSELSSLDESNDSSMIDEFAHQLWDEPEEEQAGEAEPEKEEASDLDEKINRALKRQREKESNNSGE